MVPSSTSYVDDDEDDDDDDEDDDNDGYNDVDQIDSYGLGIFIF